MKPEVWGEIRDVYEEFLGHYPHNDAARSKYAVLCNECMKYPEAQKQFELLGDNLVAFNHFPLARLKEIRADVAKQAQKVKPAGPPR